MSMSGTCPVTSKMNEFEHAEGGRARDEDLYRGGEGGMTLYRWQGHDPVQEGRALMRWDPLNCKHYLPATSCAGSNKQ